MNKNIPRTSIKSKTRFNPRWNTAIGRFEEMAGLVLFLFRCSDLCSQHLTNTGENSPRNVDDPPFKHQWCSPAMNFQLSYLVRIWSNAGLGVDLDLLFPFLQHAQHDLWMDSVGKKKSTAQLCSLRTGDWSTVLHADLKLLLPIL